MNDDTTICDPWHNNKQWMMNDEWRMIVTRRRQAEPMERNHEHQTNPLDLWPDKIQNPWSINLFSKMTQPWLIDTPTTDETLKHNKSGSLVLVPTGGSVTTLFLLLLLLWTFELYLILSSDDDPRYVSLYIITYMHSTCLWLMSFIDDRHAFYTCCCATCFYLTLDMLWTHILHVFTLRTTHGH